MNISAGITSAGGPVSLRIRFGDASIGSYAVQLFDGQDRATAPPVSGAATDRPPAPIQLPLPPAELNGRLAGIAINAVSENSRADVVSVSLEVLQGGQPVTTAPSRPTLRATIESGQYATFLFYVRFGTN